MHSDALIAERHWWELQRTLWQMRRTLVAQICNLPYRRSAICTAWDLAKCAETGPDGGRLKTCDRAQRGSAATERAAVRLAGRGDGGTMTNEMSPLPLPARR